VSSDRPLLDVRLTYISRCHVLAHESFENEEVAKIMNEGFINIKVDREERPDVDRMYMTYLQVSRIRSDYNIAYVAIGNSRGRWMAYVYM
jgi:uncharacterized protein YyaL (SSP411 family)